MIKTKASVIDDGTIAIHTDPDSDWGYIFKFKLRLVQFLGPN